MDVFSATAVILNHCTSFVLNYRSTLFLYVHHGNSRGSTAWTLLM